MYGLSVMKSEGAGNITLKQYIEDFYAKVEIDFVVTFLYSLLVTQVAFKFHSAKQFPKKKKRSRPREATAKLFHETASATRFRSLDRFI